jgi:hypothetical protein
MTDLPPSPAPRSTPAPPARGNWRRRGCFFLAVVVVLGALLFALYVWIALSYNYSEGERAGYVQKFSRKGWVCKTWEGELAMVNLPGAMPELFNFTVRDEAVARQLNENMGKRVTLHYAQHVGLPTSCFGETQYFVTGVRFVE